MAHFEAERPILVRQLRGRIEEIGASIHTGRRPMDDLRACVTGRGRGPERPPADGYAPFAPMQRWGGLDQTTWFRMTARVPKEWKGCCVAAMIQPCAYTDIPGLPFDHDQSGEGLAYVNGKPFQGLDRNHRVMILTPKAKGGEVFDIAVECTPQTRFDATHVFYCADIAVRHAEAWDFYHDLKAYLDLVEAMPRESMPRRRLLDLLTETAARVEMQRQGTPEYYASLAAASAFLREGLARLEPSHGMGALTLFGQSHIDTAWLWPLRETRRKVGRTWSTVLRLMERYPEFIFAASQPELYMFAKEHHPEVYAQIKKRAKEGRWDVCGASWVEQDSNMPAGESLVRQFLYGNRFIEREFGARTRTAWLPDAFGFPWTLPQILRKSGIEHFFTIKISWSQYTKFPYGYFLWQGADGTRIPAVMPPENYNGNPIPRDLINQRESFQQKDLVDETPFPFGYGDGGGGPTEEMIEYAMRFNNVAGVPRCSFGRTEESLDRMREQADPAKLPVWNGELYLEFHRACQTTQARTKRNHRKLECLLHNAEWLASLAALHGGPYLREPLANAWRIALTNQFHDILPGSSIAEVYQVAEEDYARARAYARETLDAALDFLASRIETTGPGTPILVFNPLSWVRTDTVEARLPLPDGAFHIAGPDGFPAPCQRIGNDSVLFLAEAVPPLGYAVYYLVPAKTGTDTSERVRAKTGTDTSERVPERDVSVPSFCGTFGGNPNQATAFSGVTPYLKVTKKLLENDFLRVELDANGAFLRVYDKEEDREILAPGEKGNALQLFDDRAGANDAWDFDFNFEDIPLAIGKATSVEIIERGPVRATVRVTRRTANSTIVQEIALSAGARRVEVAHRVDWREKHALLKTAFPVDILSPRATYHIAFGAVERTTHHNTDWDRARFEVPAHHWADLSEGDYGVSLLNDCKYGYDVHENVLRLSLLRAPVDPDPHADEGAHEYTYALYPHTGDWRNGTVQQGFELNQPLLAKTATAHPGKLPPAYAFAALDADNIVLDTVKRAEDSDAIVVRLYEANGQRGPATLTFAKRPKSVCECDLMEENDQPIECNGNEIALYVKPFEIRTLKVRF